MKLLSTLSMIWLLICVNNQSWFQKLNLTYETLQSGLGNGFVISILGKLFDCSNNSVAIDLKMNGSFPDKKYLIRCGSLSDEKLIF